MTTIEPKTAWAHRKTIPIILAGGLGKRMNSSVPKVLHEIMGQPMLIRIIDTVLETAPEEIIIVVGKFRELIGENIYSRYPHMKDKFVLVDQINPQGTGHALQCALNEIKKHQHTNFVVLSGDVPLITESLISEMSSKSDVDAALAVMDIEYPCGYGRIIMENGVFSKIVEEKDCNVTEKKITLVNCGLYMFSSECLCKYLPLLSNKNAQKEYYLTDLFGMMIDAEKNIISVVKLPVHQQYQLQGVNTPEQLKQLESMYLRNREMV